MTLTAQQEALCEHWRPTAIRWLESYTYMRIPESAKQDFISEGLLGLIDACRTWDPSRSSFPTFAYQRVIGAAIDGLRAVDWVPRSVRKMQRDIARATAKADQQGDSSDEAIAAELRITVGELAEWRHKIDKGVVADLDHPINSQGGTVLKVIADPAPRPDERAELAARSEVVSHAIARLPARERRVVELYYFEDRTLRQIGEGMGVTESRVSQMHTRALQRMRPFLKDAA